MKLITPDAMSLLEALSLMSPGSSKTTLKSWIKDKRVYMDGMPILTDRMLPKGVRVSLGTRSKFAQAGIKILYEDKSLIMIDKPSGILSVATAFQKEETAHAYLKNKYKNRKVYVIHRLDQDTSGVIAFAFSEKTAQAMKVFFEKHDIKRIYYAIVEGRIAKKSGTWQSYLYEDANYYVHSTQDEQKGEIAITHYKVKDYVKGYTLLEITLETGRKNQIRVHCQKAGHSIAGDKKYGAQTDPFKRLGLHAYMLGFIHPETNREIAAFSPMPEIFLKMFPIGPNHENA